jgi:signal transduction histidine kinase
MAVGGATFAAVLIVSMLVGLRHEAALRAHDVDTLRRAVEALALQAAPLFARSSVEADAEIRRWAAASGHRVTLIAADGRVHADSWTTPELLGRLENHAGRDEVVAAGRGEVGVAHRKSTTTDRPTTYVAQLVGSAERPLGYIRLARQWRPAVLPWSALLVALAGAAAAALAARQLEERRHRAAARHLADWSELPRDAELESLAEEADRRFRAEREELRREVEVLRAALGEVAEGVILLDGEARVHFANAAAARLCGVEPVAGHALVETSREPELLTAAESTLAERRITHASVTTMAGVELAVRVCPLQHPLLSAAVVLRDVRGERQLERARRALVADLAHELRTPVTVLAGLAEEMHETGRDGELAATLGRQVRRLRVFAEELEELAAIEAGHLRLHPESVDAAAVARQVCAELQPLAAARGVTVRLTGSPAPLRTDPVRLAQVLGNLVDNGIRYNRRGGTVTVDTAPEGDGVRVRVEDSGLGIPEADLPLVFQRFYRVRRGSEPDAGSGLGLAIVKHLVHALGGTVQLTSREDEGTQVTLHLPDGVGPAPPREP